MESNVAARFRSGVDRWYRANGSHQLPWRLTRDPYAVLVSEVMLQQTQVERVLPYYQAWLRRWPAAAALAAADTADVIRAWSGLGYNRRALNLHRAAVMVTEAGGLPRSLVALRGFPGVGPYTAAAVLSFAFEQALPVIDTNIGRVLSRSVLGQPTVRSASAIAVAAEGLVPAKGRRARDHNLALMDLGAMVCTARSPSCDRCPLATACAWRRAGYPDEAKSRARAPRFEETARFARGRIIELLRNAESLTAAELATALPAAHAARIETYVDALARDGLIQRAAHTFALATNQLGTEHAELGTRQGSRSIASPKL